MDGLIELIFEGVSPANVDAFTLSLLEQAEIIGVSHSEYGDIEPSRLGGGLRALLSGIEMAELITLRTNRVQIGSIVFAHPLLRVHHVGEAFDLEVIVDSAEIYRNGAMNKIAELAACAKETAARWSVQRYYCGFEPATDRVTLLFSDSGLEPFGLSECKRLAKNVLTREL